MKVNLSFEGNVKEIAVLLNEFAERLEKQELESANQQLQTLQMNCAKQAILRSKLNQSGREPRHQQHEDIKPQT